MKAPKQQGLKVTLPSLEGGQSVDYLPSIVALAFFLLTADVETTIHASWERIVHCCRTL